MTAQSEWTVWLFGATGGIGSAVASRLRADGARVTGFSRNAGAVASGHIGIDLTDPASVTSALATARATGGDPGAVVITVAAPAFGTFLDLDAATWRQAYDVKLFGTIDLLRRTAPAMLSRGSGRIVIVTGRGTAPPARHLPGASINAALNLIVQGLARDWSGQGVAVNAVAPGPVKGVRLDAMLRGMRPGDGLSIAPEDVADVVAFLLSPAAGAISGATLVVDRGGLRSPEPTAISPVVR